MTRAEKAALEAYPEELAWDWRDISYDPNSQQRYVFQRGYKQAEKDLINRIRKQVKMWMPEKDGEEYTDGKRLAFRSVLHLLKGLEDEK